MVKTSVYLSEDEAAALRQAALRSGRSQADLIREGVRNVVAGQPERRFASRAAGSGPAYERPDPDEIHQRVVGRE
ncbi:MAG: ribbon-helix-helix protein, CopG family [Egibacteraceae bacterium]